MLRTISIEEALDYGKQANNHARDHIKKGSTQLENNNLSEAYFDFLREGIGERGTTKGGIRDLKREIHKEKMASDPLERNPILASYETTIEVTSKYSLGNCYELAVQALDYVLNSLPGVDAEVYTIHGGDHVFLVMNRDPNSNPQDPATWGESAVISDPWSNKVYKASDYLTELKNFYRSGKKNYIEDFDPSRHVLIQEPHFNTTDLRYARNVSNLKANFLDESKHVVRMLKSYKDALSEEEERLKTKYGNNDEKVLIISEKIKVLDHAIRSTNDVVNQLLTSDYGNDYRAAKKELMEGYVSINKNAVMAMQFSKPDLSKLFEHKGPAAKKDMMRFFGVKSDTRSRLETITQDVNKQLTKAPK